MIKRLLQAVVVIAVLAKAVGELPGVIENVAFACNPSDPGCTP